VSEQVFGEVVLPSFFGFLLFVETVPAIQLSERFIIHVNRIKIDCDVNQPAVPIESSYPIWWYFLVGLFKLNTDGVNSHDVTKQTLEPGWEPGVKALRKLFSFDSYPAPSLKADHVAVAGRGRQSIADPSGDVKDVETPVRGSVVLPLDTVSDKRVHTQMDVVRTLHH